MDHVSIVEVHADESAALAEEVGVVGRQWRLDQRGDGPDAGCVSGTFEARFGDGVSEILTSYPGSERRKSRSALSIRTVTSLIGSTHSMA